MTRSFEVTGAGIDPATDRKQRTRVYIISMSIRVVCVLCLLFTPGWWAILPILGAALLPFFAVMIANNTAPQIDRKGANPLLQKALKSDDTFQRKPAPVIVVDAVTDRRATGVRISETNSSQHSGKYDSA